MSSFVFYKFKSQKEPSRVAFDGTGISVWDLKKEIIMENKMGKGGDFDFAIYNADTEEGAFSRLAFGSSLGARRWSRHAARRQLCACDQPTPLASWTSSIFKDRKNVV